MSLASRSIDTLSATRPRQETATPPLVRARSIAGYCGAFFRLQLAAAIGGGLAPLLVVGLDGSLGGRGGVSLLLISLALSTLVATLAPGSRGAARDP
jgi:hypothetical protein